MDLISKFLPLAKRKQQFRATQAVLQVPEGLQRVYIQASMYTNTNICTYVFMSVHLCKHTFGSQQFYLNNNTNNNTLRLSLFGGVASATRRSVKVS